MYEEIRERISTVAIFRNGHAFPWAFTWRGRKYKIDSINLEHTERRGDNILFCFAVTSSGNTYEISFDNKNLTWTLERVWEE